MYRKYHRYGLHKTLILPRQRLNAEGINLIFPGPYTRKLEIPSPDEHISPFLQDDIHRSRIKPLHTYPHKFRTQKMFNLIFPRAKYT